jgi:hypothetical protein
LRRPPAKNPRAKSIKHRFAGVDGTIFHAGLARPLQRKTQVGKICPKVKQMSKFNFLIAEIQAPPKPREIPWFTALSTSTAIFGAILTILILKAG